MKTKSAVSQHNFNTRIIQSAHVMSFLPQLRCDAVRTLLASSGRRIRVRAGSTHSKRRPQNHNIRNDRYLGEDADKRMKMRTREGLAISQEQIERLWNLFEGQEASSFDAKDFVSKFPRVNSFLSKKMMNVDTSVINEDSSTTFSLDLKEDPFKFSPIAEEAEEKLQRMLKKINKHDSMPPEIQTKIQNLLLQELETVLDLWLRISETAECQTLEEALAPIDRAAELLLKFQTLHEKGVKLLSKNVTAFYPPAPVVRSYQTILQEYHQLFLSAEQYQPQLSLIEIEHFQSQCRMLIKGMMRQVLTMRRMQSLHDVTSTTDARSWNTSSNQLSNTEPLNNTYTNVISMHTIPIYETSIPPSNMREMTNSASKLLQEMELYYHDFHTIPLDSSNYTTTNTTEFPADLQALLISIHPTQEPFELVIGAFLKIASDTHCKYSITRASDVLERMDKRYQAYVSNDSDNAHVCTGQVFKPDLELYMSVIGGYTGMDNLTPNDAERMTNLLKRIEEDVDIVVTDELRNMVKGIQNKSKDTTG